MKSISLTVFFTFFCCVTFVHAQIDTLLKQLAVASGEAKVDIYNELCWEYRFVSQDSAIYYADLSIALAQQIGYKKGLAQAYNDQGIIFYDRQEYSRSIENYKNALSIRTALADTIGIASLYNKLALVYQRMADWKNSLSYQQKSLSIYEQAGMMREAALSLNNIGILQYDIRNYEEALKWYNRSVEVCKKNNLVLPLIRTYVNIGNVYYSTNQREKAVEYFKMAEEHSRQSNDLESLSTILNNLGAYYKQINDRKKALAYLKEAYELRARLNDRRGMISTLINLGTVYLDNKDYAQAVLYLSTAKTLSEEVSAITELPSLYLNLSLAYEYTGDFKKALEAQKLYALYRDSILNENLISTVTEMNTKYETERKEKENIQLLSENKIKDLRIKQEQKQRRSLLLFSGVGFIFLLVLAALIVNRNNIKKKAEMEIKLSEQQAIRFKSVLEAEENERRRIARELHDGLGQILSTTKLNLSSIEEDIAADDAEIFARSMNLVDEAVSEVRSISHNLMPSTLIRNGLIQALQELVRNINSAGKVTVHFTHQVSDERLSETTETALYRIIQEVLNNMLKHAHATTINIEVKQENNTYYWRIKDDGKGFNISKIEESKGIGWKNIFSRAALFNAQVSVQSEVDKGTEVMVEFTV